MKKLHEKLKQSVQGKDNKDHRFIMAEKKIVKAGGAEPDKFELSVATEIFNLESSAADLKAELQPLYISAAKEVELDASGRKAVIIFVPFRQLSQFHKIQIRLVRELEKKFK